MLFLKSLSFVQIIETTGAGILIDALNLLQLQGISHVFDYAIYEWLIQVCLVIGKGQIWYGTGCVLYRTRCEPLSVV